MSTKLVTLKYLKKFKEIITIEDHFEDGGFGSWIRECVKKLEIKVTTKCINKKVIETVGSKSFLIKKFGPKI